jgi:hypothetical protein
MCADATRWRLRMRGPRVLGAYDESVTPEVTQGVPQQFFRVPFWYAFEESNRVPPASANRTSARLASASSMPEADRPRRAVPKANDDTRSPVLPSRMDFIFAMWD